MAMRVFKGLRGGKPMQVVKADTCAGKPIWRSDIGQYIVESSTGQLFLSWNIDNARRDASAAP